MITNIFLVWLVGTLITMVILGNNEHLLDSGEIVAWLLLWWFLVPLYIVHLTIRGVKIIHEKTK